MDPRGWPKYLFCKKNRFQDKFANSSGCANAKKRSASGGFAPSPGLCPWTPLGANASSGSASNKLYNSIYRVGQKGKPLQISKGLLFGPPCMYKVAAIKFHYNDLQQKHRSTMLLHTRSVKQHWFTCIGLWITCTTVIVITSGNN